MPSKTIVVWAGVPELLGVAVIVRGYVPVGDAMNRMEFGAQPVRAMAAANGPRTTRSRKSLRLVRLNFLRRRRNHPRSVSRLQGAMGDASAVGEALCRFSSAAFCRRVVMVMVDVTVATPGVIEAGLNEQAAKVGRPEQLSWSV